MDKNTGKKEPNYEGLAAYVGITAPETPKYLLANNFLLDYFETSRNVEQEYNYAAFQDIGTLYTEEEKNEDMLKSSFDCFFRRYLGEDSIRAENGRLNTNKHYYFPFMPDMLVSTPANLRHILFYLQNMGKDYDFRKMQGLLREYIFQDNTGINYIIKILLQSQEEEIRLKKPVDKRVCQGFWSMLNQAERGRMRRLADQFNEDLEALLTHPYFRKLDFYRRYNYLAMLLTSYVIQYIVYRKGRNVYMLCQGAPRDSRLSGAFHRASCNNYADIRTLFPDLLKAFYTKTIKNKNPKVESLLLLAKDGKVSVNGTAFEEFLAETFQSKRRGGRKITSEDVRKAFGLEEGKKKIFSVEEFVVRYIHMMGTRQGSTLAKISSTLPTSGRQIDMVFPQNRSNKKYFAMSENLSEFYIRLYLARKGQKYDYLDHFIRDLQERYHIVLVKSPEGERALRAARISLSAQEYGQNKRVFTEMLSGINCLIKLSDSGYVITLPEEKGDFKLL